MARGWRYNRISLTNMSTGSISLRRDVADPGPLVSDHVLRQYDGFNSKRVWHYNNRPPWKFVVTRMDFKRIFEKKKINNSIREDVFLFSTTRLYNGRDLINNDIQQLNTVEESRQFQLFLKPIHAITNRLAPAVAVATSIRGGTVSTDGKTFCHDRSYIIARL